MRVHPQIYRTVQMIEELRRGRKPKILAIRFGKLGLESVVIDGEEIAGKLVGFHVEHTAGNKLDT